jgi:hypothetical protein
MGKGGCRLVGNDFSKAQHDYAVRQFEDMG